jgi:hypothetical protein
VHDGTERRLLAAGGSSFSQRHRRSYNAPAKRQIERARDDDPDEPAQVRAAEQPDRDRPLQRRNETVLVRSDALTWRQRWVLIPGLGSGGCGAALQGSIRVRVALYCLGDAGQASIISA